MEQFIIKGPVKLRGEVNISGAKNAALPIIAASILFDEPVTLNNIPHIKDIVSLLGILEDLGVSCDFKKDVLRIDPRHIKNSDPSPDLVRNLRASVLLLAPLLVRNKEVNIPHPGGCLIGSRPIDVHLKALRNMGADVITDKDSYNVIANRLSPAVLFADFSVTGTENLIMASVLTKGTTEIRLAAAEPHVQDLCNFLNAAGASISGVGTHNLIIKGTDKLRGVKHTIIPDQIESGTFAIAAAASKGEVTINGFVVAHHDALLSKFDKANVKYEILGDDKIRIIPSHQLKAFNVRTEIYPGFPTDLQAPMAVLATQANGTSEIYETIFEGRLGYIPELSKMGSSCITRDVHQASITGPSPLFGTRITSFDLRAGATLIIAALIAQGESRLDQIEIIDRGYDDIEGKLKGLGAEIKRVKLKEIE
jgi:UDP-N-acetylglucosamine 1-carboxyvinyltransferase